MKGFLFVARRLLNWFLLLFVVLFVWSGMMGARPGVWAVVAFFLLLGVAIRSVSHVHRVGLIAPKLDAEALGLRHRRTIEMPFPADEAFAMVEAAICELPGVEVTECARDSLQLLAQAPRRHPYIGGNPAAASRRRRNLIRATITPGERTASVALLCEPAGGVWSEWLRVDFGTNYENAEAIVRALARRVSERRKAEEARGHATAVEKELAIAKLNLLHAQVEPHFLYNTLASAQLLTRSDPAKADEMLGHLIVYLRRSLPRTGEAPSTLGEELERARAYLEILRIRMGERLRLQVRVDDALHAAPFPAMMLQTLVENAIKHGLEPVPGGGTIWILARRVEGSVAVTVADDGRGFGGDNGGTGIGLANVRERLRLAYGDAASLTVTSNFPNGVAATIAVPFAARTEGSHA